MARRRKPPDAFPTCVQLYPVQHKGQRKGDSLRRQTKKTEDYCAKRGWTLDTTLQPADLGMGAYHGRNRTHGALAGFLALCGTPRVPKGSVLIVESLDRLSRQDIDDADQLICGILRKGISIVTLTPERELTPKSVNDLLARIELLVLASRANEEERDQVGASEGRMGRTA